MVDTKGQDIFTRVDLKNVSHGITVGTSGSGSVFISDCFITDKICGPRGIGIRVSSVNGDITIEGCSILENANITSIYPYSKDGYSANVQGILAWSYGSGKVTIRNTEIGGSLTSASYNAFGIDEQTQSGSTGKGLVEDCTVSAGLIGNYAYGIAVAVIEDGTTVVQNSIVNATLNGSANSHALAIFDNVK